MAPGLYGADIAQLRALSKSMDQSGTRLRTVESTVNSMVQSAAWKGPDGDTFRSEWTSTLRPLLNKSSTALRAQSRALLGQADEQARASGAAGVGSGNDGGGSGNSASGGTASGRDWSDAFTDPNFEHAPSGIEWLFDKLGVNNASVGSAVANSLKFVADKFGWNLDLAQVPPGTSRFFDAVSTGGKVLGVLGGAIGVLDIISGVEGNDPFRIADGVIGGGLSIAAIAATGTIMGAPAGVVLGAAALGWGLLGMASGDVPVTKRVWDAGAAVVGGISDAGGWMGSRLGFG